jgi:hypothetical protein
LSLQRGFIELQAYFFLAWKLADIKCSQRL